MIQDIMGWSKLPKQHESVDMCFSGHVAQLLRGPPGGAPRRWALIEVQTGRPGGLENMHEEKHMLFDPLPLI